MADRPFSLRGRLLRLLMVPLLTLFVISAFISYVFAVHFSNSVYDAWLYDSASSLEVALTRTAHGPRLDLSGATEDVFRWDIEDLTYYQVVGPHSGVLGGRRVMPGVPADARRYNNAWVYNATLDKRRVRVVALDVSPAAFGEPLRIYVGETTGKRENLARQVLAGILLSEVLLISVAGLTIWNGIRWSLRPLQTLAAEVAAKDDQHLTPVASRDAPSEVEPLMRALNTLLIRVDTVLAGQRRFVADAAHQLRTPVTALKMSIEQALGTRTFEEVQPVLVECRRAVDRMARLTNQLLVLARSGPEALEAMPMQRINLVQLVQETGARWVPRALAKRIDLSLQPEAQTIEIFGRADLLGELVDNLLDNAIQYHPGGGCVWIRLRARPAPELIVEDDGPGIPAELRAEVVKRFRRGPNTARSGGSGLGLAIVEEIVAIHHGQVRLDAPDDHPGLRVSIVFPALSGGATSLTPPTGPVSV